MKVGRCCSSFCSRWYWLYRCYHQRGKQKCIKHIYSCRLLEVCISLRDLICIWIAALQSDTKVSLITQFEAIWFYSVWFNIISAQTQNNWILLVVQELMKLNSKRNAPDRMLLQTSIPQTASSMLIDTVSAMEHVLIRNMEAGWFQFVELAFAWLDWMETIQFNSFSRCSPVLYWIFAAIKPLTGEVRRVHWRVHGPRDGLYITNVWS